MSCLNINEVRLAGRVVNDPELKSTPSGTFVTSFRIAVNRPKAEGKPDEADFITITAWQKKAEFVTKYFKKGMAIYIVGALRLKTWNDKNAEKRSSLEVRADEIQFIDSKNDNGNTVNDEQPASPTEYTPKFETLEDDEELPF